MAFRDGFPNSNRAAGFFTTLSMHMFSLKYSEISIEHVKQSVFTLHSQRIYSCIFTNLTEHHAMKKYWGVEV